MKTGRKTLQRNHTDNTQGRLWASFVSASSQGSALSLCEMLPSPLSSLKIFLVSEITYSSFESLKYYLFIKLTEAQLDRAQGLTHALWSSYPWADSLSPWAYSHRCLLRRILAGWFWGFFGGFFWLLSFCSISFHLFLRVLGLKHRAWWMWVTSLPQSLSLCALDSRWRCTGAVSKPSHTQSIPKSHVRMTAVI